MNRLEELYLRKQKRREWFIQTILYGTPLACGRMAVTENVILFFCEASYLLIREQYFSVIVVHWLLLRQGLTIYADSQLNSDSPASACQEPLPLGLDICFPSCA